MNDSRRRTTFRGSPLTAPQESEIRHHIRCRQRNGLPWDTSELDFMIQDMLSPPELIVGESMSVGEAVLKENAAAAEDGCSDESELD